MLLAILRRGSAQPIPRDTPLAMSMPWLVVAPAAEEPPAGHPAHLVVKGRPIGDILALEAELDEPWHGMLNGSGIGSVVIGAPAWGWL